jgi:hypothetical protein
MDYFINQIAAWAGINPMLIPFILAFVVAAANLIGRLIPDDATGFLGVIRKIAKVVGLYLSNRISSGVSVNAVTRASAETLDLVDQIPEPAPLLPPVTQAERDARGRFVGAKVNSHWIGSLLIGLLLASMLAGCVTDSQISTSVCSHRIAVRFAANQAMQAAELIKDPSARQAAMDAAQVTLDLVNACPPVNVVTAGVY